MQLIHVTVAFNSPSELEMLLESIIYQEEDEHYLICIDNSDAQYKEKNRIICDHYSSMQNYNVEYYPLKKNYGSATGFAIGMTLGYNAGAEYIWLHDQDGYPIAKCLYEMQKFMTKDFLILSPKIIDQNNEYLSAFHGNYDKHMNKLPVILNGEFTWSEVAGTAGLCISRKLINKIGVYDYKHYFTGNEDFDYCWRSLKCGIKVCVVNDAYYYHPNKHEGIVHFTQIQRYFGDIKSSDTSYRTFQDIYYYIKHIRKNIVIDLLFSLAKVHIKKLLFEPVRLIPTLKCYYSALICRSVFSNRKVMINFRNYFE